MTDHISLHEVVQILEKYKLLETYWTFAFRKLTGKGYKGTFGYEYK